MCSQGSLTHSEPISISALFLSTVIPKDRSHPKRSRPIAMLSTAALLSDVYFLIFPGVANFRLAWKYLATMSGFSLRSCSNIHIGLAIRTECGTSLPFARSYLVISGSYLLAPLIQAADNGKGE